MIRPENLFFDVETVSVWDALDDERRAYLSNGSPAIATADTAALSPFAGRVACIGWAEEQGFVRVIVAARQPVEATNSLIEWVGDERALLERWWSIAARYRRIIGWNSRGFDAPFLRTRSIIANVPPTRNLLPYRYSFAEHCDLLEVVTAFGNTRRVSLDCMCRSVGIESPKAAGVAGNQVEQLWREERLVEIAEYCARDVAVLRPLFERLRPEARLMDPKGGL